MPQSRDTLLIVSASIGVVAAAVLSWFIWRSGDYSTGVQLVFIFLRWALLVCILVYALIALLKWLYKKLLMRR